MGSKSTWAWRCAECSCVFRRTAGEVLHAAGNACPGCGSRFVDRVTRAVKQSPVPKQFGYKKAPAPGEDATQLRFPKGRTGSEKAQVIKARKERLLSSPTKYRFFAIKFAHNRAISRRKQQERDRRAQDFTPM